MEEKNGNTFTKKDLKLQIQERKLEEKARKAQEKAEIRSEKERIRNSFGTKVKNFFLTIFFVIILVIIAFFVCKELLARKEKELSNERMQQIYQIAVELLDEKKYEESLNLLNSITRDFENYGDVSKKIKEVEQLYLNKYLVDADKYLKEKRYNRALETLNQINQNLITSELVREKKSEITISKITDDISNMEKEKNTIEILKYLSSYDDEGLVDVIDKIDELMIQYKNAAIMEIRDLMHKNFNEAKNKIQQIEEIMPDDQDVIKLVEEISEKEPISLLTLEETEKVGRLTVGTENENYKIEDSEGNTFKDYIVTLLFNQENNSISYNLDKKYAILTGKIGVSKAQENSKAVGNPKVNIYGDDKIIYSSNNLDNKSKTKDFSIDVSNVKKLKIEIISDYNMEIFMAEPKLVKK